MNDLPAKEATTRERARLIVGALLLALLVGFVLDNTQSVRVGFVFVDREPPLIWVLVVTALLGAALDRLVQWRRGR